MFRAKCVVRDDPDPNDPVFFEQVMRAVSELASLGLVLDFLSEEDVEDDALQLTWQEKEEQAELHLIKDRYTGATYFSMSAVKAADLRLLTESLERHLDLMTQEELLAAAQRDMVLEPVLLLKLAMVARRPDQDVIATLREALEHRLPQVRYYSAYAMGVAMWSVFVADLEVLLKCEPDKDVVEMAEKALESCQWQASKG